ncbi:MAG: hypothetical protein FIA91_12785 [Geobacter sp.]|nr:hypothetical protein [Geobacter sp.]
MGDNSDEKLEQLFAAARSGGIDTASLEEHFETRLMARIAERNAGSMPWYLLVWRMIPGFAVATLITAACSLIFNPSRYSDLFAGITVGQEDTITISSLVGE